LDQYPEGSKTEPAKVSEEELKKFVGVWRSEKTHAPARFVIEKGMSRWSGARLVPLGGGQFVAGDDRLKFSFDKDGKPISAEMVDSDGEVRRFALEKEWMPSPDELSSIKGDWFSEEAGATFTLAVDNGKAFIKQRPATTMPMQPLYKDHFLVQGSVVWFTRDTSGQVDAMHVGASRMRDMLFVRAK